MNEEITHEIREKVLIDFYKYVAQEVSPDDLQINKLTEPINDFLNSINECKKKNKSFEDEEKEILEMTKISKDIMNDKYII